MSVSSSDSRFFFFNDTATTEIYTLSLHDALPISRPPQQPAWTSSPRSRPAAGCWSRSEEHTSELQSHSDLVCRLLLEKKKKTRIRIYNILCVATMTISATKRSRRDDTCRVARSYT